MFCPGDYPPENTAELNELTSKNLEFVNEPGGPIGNRDACFSYLRSFGPQVPDPTGYAPVGFSVSREAFYRTSGGGVAVLEFTYPIAPKGKSIVYHPAFPLRIVTYFLNKDGLLQRVEYGPAMDSYNWLLKKDAG